MKIGVVGNGFVGRATQIFGQAAGVALQVYDVDPAKCVPPGTTLGMLAQHCDIIFVCVPTPFDLDQNECDTSIVRSVVGELHALDCQASIVCRSTVPPGTCKQIGVAHMPEYLTERNWHQDFINTAVWELGLPSAANTEKCAQTLQALLTQCKTAELIVSDRLVVKDSNVTEMAKLVRNSMLAVRVAVCNEYEEYCRAVGIDYEEVRKLATADARIGASHTQVPGPDGKRGFGGTCLPKDLRALIGCMTRADVVPVVLRACSDRNDCIDRPDQDWMQRGRSVTKK